MRLMHTKLPEFYEKVAAAAKKAGREDEVSVSLTGLEQFKTAKLASASVGIIEEDIYELAKNQDLEKIEIKIMPQLPETLHTVIIKGINKDGTSKKAYLETVYISEPGPDYYYHDTEEVIDRRAPFN